MTFLDTNIDTSKIIDQLNAIATPAVKQLLETYTKQAIIQGNVDTTVGHWMIGIAIGLVVLGIGLFILCGVLSSGSDYNAGDGEMAALIFGVLFIVGALIIGGFGIGNIVQGTQELANPQYYAVQDLLKHLP